MENIILTNNKDLRLVSVKVGVLSTLRFELPLVSASATQTNGRTIIKRNQSCSTSAGNPATTSSPFCTIEFDETGHLQSVT